MTSKAPPSLPLASKTASYLQKWLMGLLRTCEIEDRAACKKIRTCTTYQDVISLMSLLNIKGLLQRLRVCADYKPAVAYKTVQNNWLQEISTIQILFTLQGSDWRDPQEFARFVVTQYQAKLVLPGGTITFGDGGGMSQYNKNGFRETLRPLPAQLAKNFLQFYRLLLNSPYNLTKGGKSKIVFGQVVSELDALESNNLKGTFSPELAPNLPGFFAMVDKVFATATSPNGSLAARYKHLTRADEGDVPLTAEQLFSKMALDKKWLRNFVLTAYGSEITAISARIAIRDRNGRLIDVLFCSAGCGARAGMCAFMRCQGFTVSTLARQENVFSPRDLQLLCENPKNITKMQNVLRAFLAYTEQDKITRQYCQSVLLFLSTLLEGHAAPQIKSLQDMNNTKAC